MFEVLVAIAVRLATLQVLLGWVLSALSWLAPEAWLLVGLPASLAVVAVSWRGAAPGAKLRLAGRVRTWWRQRRVLPLLFCASFILIAAGALWHEPNNFDGLSYRIPRVLYWLKDHRWTWIDTPYAALNHTMPNHEWVSLPLFLAGGARLMVLINLVSFLLVPPLWFALLRRFGVSGRLAWDWMWIFPAGYLVAMQAGGIGNDLTGLTAILASLFFAARFAERGRGGDLFDALLAAGLCTGIKLSNLPLAAFAGVLLLGSLKKVLACRVAAAAGLVFGLAVSAAIPLALNFAFSGSILGTKTGMDQVELPLAGLLGNLLILLVSAIAPPLLPGAGRFGDWAERILGGELTGWLHAHYAKFTLKLNEMPQEEVGGLGLGITLALLAAWALGRRGQGQDCRRPAAGLTKRMLFAWWFFLVAGGLPLLAKLGTGPAVPRNLMPWMPLVLAPLLAAWGCQHVVRSRWWKAAAVFAAAGVLPALVLTPSRPLFPSAFLLGLAERAGLQGPSVARARVVYGTYQNRPDPFAEIRRVLPDEIRTIGLVSDGSEPTASWMRPYGRRFCVYLRSAGEVASARKAGLEYVVLKEPVCRACFQMSPEEWCAQFRATILKTLSPTIHAADGPVKFVLVKLQP